MILLLFCLVNILGQKNVLDSKNVLVPKNSAKVVNKLSNRWKMILGFGVAFLLISSGYLHFAFNKKYPKVKIDGKDVVFSGPIVPLFPINDSDSKQKYIWEKIDSYNRSGNIAALVSALNSIGIDDIKIEDYVQITVNKKSENEFSVKIGNDNFKFEDFDDIDEKLFIAFAEAGFVFFQVKENAEEYQKICYENGIGGMFIFDGPSIDARLLASYSDYFCQFDTKFAKVWKEFVSTNKLKIKLWTGINQVEIIFDKILILSKFIYDMNFKDQLNCLKNFENKLDISCFKEFISRVLANDCLPFGVKDFDVSSFKKVIYDDKSGIIFCTSTEKLELITRVNNIILDNKIAGIMIVKEGYDLKSSVEEYKKLFYFLVKDQISDIFCFVKLFSSPLAKKLQGVQKEYSGRCLSLNKSLKVVESGNRVMLYDFDYDFWVDYDQEPDDAKAVKILKKKFVENEIFIYRGFTFIVFNEQIDSSSLPIGIIDVLNKEITPNDEKDLDLYILEYLKKSRFNYISEYRREEILKYPKTKLAQAVIEFEKYQRSKEQSPTQSEKRSEEVF